MSDLDDMDASIAILLAGMNKLKGARMAKLSPCSFCNGTGKLGTDAIWSVCSVCRGLNVDMGELWELRKRWGEVSTK